MDEAFFHGLLQRGAQAGASDAIFKVGQPPAFRVRGSLHYLQGERMLAGQTEAIARLILAGTQYTGDVATLTEYDTSYGASGVGRYRVNIFRQRGTIAIAMRNIPLDIPTIAELGCSPVAAELASLDRGMVLVVGAAGNGKSSTLAAMVGHINQTRRSHVITIEDPVEFLHTDQKATISQREIGLDTPDFATALRAALRQNPDVILVGEIRDEETMSIAMKAAETGHLVLSTLHTPDVARTVGRVLSLMGGEDARETRERFAQNLKGVMAQRLVRGTGEHGRVLAQEVLVVTGTARESIRSPQTNMPLQDVMTKGEHPYGMQTFKMHLTHLVSEGKIDADTARRALD